MGICILLAWVGLAIVAAQALPGVFLLLVLAAATGGLWTLKFSSRHNHIVGAGVGASNGIGGLLSATFWTIATIVVIFPMAAIVLIPLGLFIRTR